jgi:D-alanine-D-alanine ligase-like ATP-grasp enzyme/ribosomal protein S18 acetylase RimI-like enzyme
VLDEAAFVERGLAELGIPSERRAIAGPEALAGLAEAARAPGTVIFNLIESPPGEWWRQCAAAGALELFGVPFTGAPTAALWLTTDKLLTRALLASEGLPVAPGGQLDHENPSVLDRVAPPWILKPACEDASVGLDGNPICTTREEALARAAALERRFPGQRIVAEHFLPGRELNVSLLEGPDGPEVLPIPEMTYVDYPEGMPKIMGWDAKWGEGTFAYDHTVRRFLTDPADEPLLARVRSLVREAWRVCDLTGYARVDLRLDESGNPCILEVNANPCIAEGAGLEVSAAQAGISRAALIQRILDAAVRRHPRSRPRERPNVAIRRTLEPDDREPLEDLIRATGFFNPEETTIALDLADDRLENGEASHYRFLVGEVDGRLAGYACWGTIDGTQASVDLYWIAVHPDFQGQGIGAALLDDAEAWIAASGRTRVYVETSTRAQYESTRGFYRARGYELSAELADFYAPGDGKAMFVKVLGEEKDLHGPDGAL